MSRETQIGYFHLGMSVRADTTPPSGQRFTILLSGVIIVEVLL